MNFQADYTDYHEEFAQLRCCANSSREGKGWLRGVLRVASSFGPPVKPFFVCLCSIMQLESDVLRAKLETLVRHRPEGKSGQKE